MNLNKNWQVALLAVSALVPVMVQTAPAVAADQVQAAQAQQEPLPPVNLMSSNQVPLDGKEAAGVALANQWKNHPDRPQRGADGSVVYLYGATLPTLVCAPLEVCAIRLQAGEVINYLHSGDTVRWRITPATSGVGEGATTHVIIKPTDAGLTTNIFIATDRRTYSIKLTSTQRAWIVKRRPVLRVKATSRFTNGCRRERGAGRAEPDRRRIHGDIGFRTEVRRERASGHPRDPGGDSCGL